MSLYTPYYTTNGLGGGALGFAWAPLQVGDSIAYATYDPYTAVAKYYGTQIQNEIQGLMAGSIADPSYLVQYTCLAADAVGSPVYNSANDTVTTASASDTVKNQVVGFIRQKGAIGAASVPSATTCYISHLQYISGLSGGSAAANLYLTNSGSFSATPGTIKTIIGKFISATEAVAVAFPYPIASVSPTNPQVKTEQVLSPNTGTSIYRAWELFQ